MLNPVIAERYALALVALAKKQSILSEIEIELRTVECVFREVGQLQAFLKAPQISKEIKVEVVTKVFKNKIQTPIYHFILLLLKKNRMEYFLDSCLAFYKLCHSERGVTLAKVISAVPINDDLKSKLMSSLEKMIAKKLEAEYIVDQNILGGLSVQVEDLLMDGSVRNKLNRLIRNLFMTKVH